MEDKKQILDARKQQACYFVSTAIVKLTKICAPKCL